jgi:hypothetical protein
VPTRPLSRFLTIVGLIAGGLVGVVGGLSLRGPGIVAVGVAGALAACLGWGMAREADHPRRRTVAESAVLAAGWTVGVLLVLTGTSVLAGGLMAALLAGAGAVAALVFWVVRSPRQESPAPSAPRTTSLGNTVRDIAPLGRAPRADAVRDTARAVRPVAELSTEALGHEWVETTVVLNGRLRADEARSLVCRRQETLDELERRDPVGFARWLLDGATSDPSVFVRGRAGKAGEAAGESSADAA